MEERSLARPFRGGKHYRREQRPRSCPSALDRKAPCGPHHISWPALPRARLSVPPAPRSSLSAVSKPAYAPPFPSSAFPSLPSPKEDRTSNSLPLATHTRPVLSSPRFLASADSLNSGEGGGEQQGCIILHPCPCFWELSLDTPCQRRVHVHPQSFEGSGPVPARSRGALQRGGPRRSQGLRKQWPCELHDQLSPLSAPWVQQRVRRTGGHRAETGWGWKREPLPLFTADKNWQDR